MSQTTISLNLSDEDFQRADEALTTLETIFVDLIDLSTEKRRTLTKMGQRSEPFCRQTVTVMTQNPSLIPPSLNLSKARHDVGQLDATRIRTARVRQLLGRLDDSEMALGSDIMSFSLEGYALLKVLGKGSGLDALKNDISARFNRRSAKAGNPDAET